MPYPPLRYLWSDAGRFASGEQGSVVADCVARSVAIAAELPYRSVVEAFAALSAAQPPTRGRRTAHDLGVDVTRAAFKHYMRGLGFRWHATRGPGMKALVGLRAEALPSGRLVVSLGSYYTAMVDGICRDIYDPTRNGTRTVYGYWRKA